MKDKPLKDKLWWHGRSSFGDVVHNNECGIEGLLSMLMGWDKNIWAVHSQPEIVVISNTEVMYVGREEIIHWKLEVQSLRIELK